MRRLVTCAASVVAVVAVSAVPASSASAATCRRVKAGEVSKFKERGPLGRCKGALAASGYVRTTGAGVAVPGEAGIECYRVEGGEPSGWNNNNCTKANAGNSEFVKIEEGKCPLMSEEPESEEPRRASASLLGTVLRAPPALVAEL